MIRVALLAAVAAAALSGCVSGRIDSQWPYPVESAAPVSKARGEPLRQMQVALADLIESRLINDGMIITDNKRGVRVPVGQAQTEPSNTIYVGKSRYTVRPGEPVDTESRAAANARDYNARLDQLIAAVRDAHEPEEVRNDVVAAWVGASTANCTVYVQALRSGQVSSRLLTDFLSGGLAGAATLTTPMRSARLLSSLSAFSTAEGASIDRNIFAQQGAELVADAILQLRAQTRTRIEGKMREGYDTWPMGVAVADLFQFQNDCSMLRGFAQMRDALLVREQLVAATREAAAGVARNGGTPDQMMAVLAALQTGAGAPPPPDPLAAWDKDLRKQKTNALKCLEAAQVRLLALKDLQDLTAVRKALDDDVYKAGGACPMSAAWEDRLNAQAKKALDDQLDALKSADKELLDVKAASQTPSTDDDKKKIKAAEDVRASKLTGLFKNAATNFDTATKIMINNNAGARAAVMSQLSNIKGGKAKPVADLIRATRDTGYKGDRVLEAALTNAEAVEKDTDDGALAAKQALGAAKGVQDL